MTSKEFDFLDGIDSKEALKILRTSANTYCQHNDTQCKVNKELYEIILKDLEILEILRNNITYVDIVKEQKETLEITIRVKEEDRPKIKEWLGNDK